MRRREFIALFGASVTSPFAAMAQQAGRTYHVGGLSSSPPNAPPIAAMFDEIQRQGFIVDQNLTVEWRSYGARIDQVPEFVAELVNAHVDVFYVASTPRPAMPEAAVSGLTWNNSRCTAGDGDNAERPDRTSGRF